MLSNPSLPSPPEPHWPLEALADVAASAAVVLSASRVWIALRDRHGFIVSRIAYTITPEGAPQPIAPDSIPQMFADNIRNLAQTPVNSTPLALSDLHTTPLLAEQLGSDSAAIRALGSAPLILNGETIGALVVTSSQPRSFEGNRRVILKTFAKMASDTIQMAASVERDQAQAAELDAILSASQALTSTLDPDELFRTIIEHIQRVITFDSALIYRHERRAERLRVIAAAGADAERLNGSTIAEDTEGSRVAQVARKGKPYNGPVGPADGIGEHTNALIKGSTAWLLCMPLIAKGRLRGVASLARVHAFSTSEVRALERLSPIVAAALENVGLYQQSQAERQQLEALFDSASDGIALLNEDLAFIQVNRAFAGYLATDENTLLRLPACKALGRATDSSHAPGSCLLCKGEPDCLLRQVMRTGVQRDHVECEFPPTPVAHGQRATAGSDDATRRSEGPALVARTIDFSLTPIPGLGRRQRLLLVGRDVSSERAMQRFRAEQVNLISHDMANPLYTVTSALELFLKLYGDRLPPPPLKSLSTALTSARSISDLLSDLDLVTRRDAGQLTFEPRQMDLAVEAQQAAQEMTFAAQEQGVTLSFQLDRRMPLALADPKRALQVARNLIGNAIKYTPPGGWVVVRLVANERMVTLQVADTGVGIPDAAKEYDIWRRYYQVDKEAPGSGLGLASVRIIATALHGDYGVIDNPAGRGSIFSVSFPRADRR
ncbi:MAG TPA: GAF domain-containing protein [Ktedonobacterales bacterium]|nr:GAF domain-containing protein [Ktedonobacterales bacterium]